MKRSCGLGSRVSSRHYRHGKFRGLLLETLEPRRLLSVVLISKTAMFTDVDGDQVLVSVNKGTLSAALFTSTHVGLGDQLEVIDLSGGGVEGADLTISVVRAATGDGLVNVGSINSTGHNLGKVTVAGDLGRIDAGTGSATTPAIRSLTVRSLGRLGLDSQGGTGSLTSNINGTLNSLTVKADVQGVTINVTGGIGAVTIAGALLGGAGVDTGQITCTGNMGAVKIGSDVVGGSGANSGAIQCGGALTSVKIGGSLIGGVGSSSGMIASAHNMGAVTIAGSVVGGAGSGSGVIHAGGKLSGVTVGDSLIGSVGDGSGAVWAQSDMGDVKIGQNIQGGSVAGTLSLNGSGYILAGGRINSITLGGSIIAGLNAGSGTLTQSGAIQAGNDIGSLKVKGSIIGNATNPVVITARGKAVSGGSDVALGSVTVTGRVEWTNILAGYSVGLVPTNGDAQIGQVKVSGDWVASNLVAGVGNTASNNTSFGDGNDASIGVGKAGIVASIAGVTIGGAVFGTPGSISAADHFGFVAQKIASFKIGGFGLALTASKETLVVGGTRDVTVGEV